MNRRDFIKLSGTAAAGTLLSTSLPGELLAVKTALPNLAVARGSSPAAITKAAIDTLGGIRRFIARGDVVVVKPNIGWDRLPEHAANTNPEVVAEIVRLCFEAGASKVKVFGQLEFSTRDSTPLVLPDGGNHSTTERGEFRETWVQSRNSGGGRPPPVTQVSGTGDSETPQGPSPCRRGRSRG